MYRGVIFAVAWVIGLYVIRLRVVARISKRHFVDEEKTAADYCVHT